MKLILSRKGFDSSYGGCPSPVLPNSNMVSLPIPYKTGIPFTKVMASPGLSLAKIMRDICPEPHLVGKKGTLEMPCHLDPDLNFFSLPRPSGWRTVFGQNNAAAGHLMKNNVSKGDIFLFFGWFQQTKYNREGRLKFYGDSFHAIYGYFQIESIHQPSPLFWDSLPDFAKDHAHMHPELISSKNNTLFISSNSLSVDPSLKGAGIFKWRDVLRLSIPGMTRSCWSLPSAFKDTVISYHTKNSWKKDHFKACARGQEFVIEANESVKGWLQQFFSKIEVFKSL